MRILLIEDDNQLASFIIKGLKERGFAVDYAEDGQEGLHFALTEPYDVIIVDIMLPKMNGLTVIKELRRSNQKVPILILSAKREVGERVKGLNVGSDDYLTKPFAFVELEARISALVRRSTLARNNHCTEAGEISLNRLTRKVMRGALEIELMPKEFSILEYLMQNPGQVVTRTMLIEHIWDFQFDPSTNIVDVHICHLRDKIDKNFEVKYIHTIRGVGYVFKLPK